jgi:ATP-dependent DNA helicase RecQ
VPKLDGNGIIYTLTVRDAVQVTDWLKLCGVSVECYTGQTGEDRPTLERALMENRVKALVATTALGMGFDKPDLAFVIHYQKPGSVVAYYQQVGRAGRSIPSAYGILLSGEEDAQITNYFIRSAFPTPDEVQAVMNALVQSPAGLSIDGLMGSVNLSKGRIDKTLVLLSLESPAPVVKQGTRWQLTAGELADSFWERAERLTELRHTEERQMQEYVNLNSGHMEFLIRALDGEPESVDNSLLPPLPVMASPQMVHEAIAFLRRTNLWIEPRKKWPTGGLPHMLVRGNIAAERQAQRGKALCVWGDAGWGSLVRQGKHDNRFADDLVDACLRLVQEWDMQPVPTWLTCVPSRRHPQVVPDFARRLADVLKLPFHEALRKTDNRPEQKTMCNSTQQARNVDGSLEVLLPVPSGPVLLVDDVVNSGWTVTIAAYLLQSNGGGAVFPLALALTGNDALAGID